MFWSPVLFLKASRRFRWGRWSINPLARICNARRTSPASRMLMAGLVAMACAGCRQDMHNQPKFVPQRSTTFFADGRSVRPQVDHTVAPGPLDNDSYFYTGLM